MKKVLKMFKANLARRSGCAAFAASGLLSGSGLGGCNPLPELDGAF